MEYTIGCRVSGGITGTREALLKINGQVARFETREEAEKALPKSRTSETGVDFRYWIIEN